MTPRLTSTIDQHGKVLELLAKRQQILAGNIANADTPGFKARDIDFPAALVQAHNGQRELPTTHTRHITVEGISGASAAAPVWRASEQPSMDGNTVDLDRERANFADNALRYEATLRFINGHVRTVLSAITGQ